MATREGSQTARSWRRSRQSGPRTGEGQGGTQQGPWCLRRGAAVPAARRPSGQGAVQAPRRCVAPEGAGRPGAAAQPRPPTWLSSWSISCSSFWRRCAFSSGTMPLHRRQAHHHRSCPEVTAGPLGGAPATPCMARQATSCAAEPEPAPAAPSRAPPTSGPRAPSSTWRCCSSGAPPPAIGRCAPPPCWRRSPAVRATRWAGCSQRAPGRSAGCGIGRRLGAHREARAEPDPVLPRLQRLLRLLLHRRIRAERAQQAGQDCVGLLRAQRRAAVHLGGPAG
jgi:hypothetical protein